MSHIFWQKNSQLVFVKTRKFGLPMYNPEIFENAKISGGVPRGPNFLRFRI